MYISARFQLSPDHTFIFMFANGTIFARPPAPKLFYQILNFGMIVSSALMIWKGLMVVTGSESPIVVVLR